MVHIDLSNKSVWILIVYKNFAKSNIGTSIVPRTMPGLDFPMLVVFIVLKSILCKSSDFVTRRTKSGQPDEAALYLQVT